MATSAPGVSVDISDLKAKLLATKEFATLDGPQGQQWYWNRVETESWVKFAIAIIIGI